MSIGAAAAYFGFHLRRAGAVSAGDLLFLLSLGLFLGFLFCGCTECRAAKGDAAHNGLRYFFVASLSQNDIGGFY